MSEHLSPGSHLSDEQLADLLGHAAPVEAEEHLSDCPLCRREFDSLRSSLADFNELSLTWAGQQAPRRIPVPSRSALLWQRVPAWSAVAAVLVTGVFGAATHRYAHPVPATSAVASATVAASTEDDDRLLLAIDQEVRVGTRSSLSASALGLAEGDGARPAEQPRDN